MMRLPALAFCAALSTACLASSGQAARGGGQATVDQRGNLLTKLFRLMGSNAIWTHVGTIAIDWPTFHTQGMVKIGETFYVSSVEVISSTVRNGTVTDALSDFSIDRSPGTGRGWLFKFNSAGQLLGRIELTDGTKYHPGGIDYDGRFIWVPVGEYRPNGKSNIYRVDPATLAAELVFNENDHIGGVVHNVHRGTLHGVSWGSRRMYTWRIAGRPDKPHVVSSEWTSNPQFYIDYQDCHYQAVEFMLCGGVTGYSTPLGSIAFGGLDLIDLRRGRPEHQVPVNLFIDEGSGPNPSLALTHNAFWIEPLDQRSLRAYFMTESDNQADLLIYDATPQVNRQAGLAHSTSRHMGGFMKRMCMVAALTGVLFGLACGGNKPNEAASRASAPAEQDDSKQAAFTEADLDKFERGLRKEIDAVKAAQEKVASAATAQERGQAIQAQFETATIPLGAEASGLSEPRYRAVRDGVNRVFTILDFQGKIDGPLSIDLQRADAETKARVSGDAFADLPPDAAMALRARMDRLVPLWSEYKKLVAVAG